MAGNIRLLFLEKIIREDSFLTDILKSDWIRLDGSNGWFLVVLKFRVNLLLS